MKKVLAVLTVAMFFCIATAGGAFAADAKETDKTKTESRKHLDFCGPCNKAIKGLIIASDAGSCPALAAYVAVGCEAALALETEGAATVVCAGIGVAVDITCAESGEVKKLKDNIDANVSKICKKVKACK